MWSEEQDATIVELWERGESASYIAKRIGDKTRNAVLGRLHRIRLSGGKVAKRTRSSLPKPARAFRRPRAAIPRPPRPIRLAGPLKRPHRVLEALPPPVVNVKPGEVEPNGTPASLVELCAAACRWSVSQTSPHLFCNKVRRGGSPYCDEHTLKSYQPLPARNQNLGKTF